ncbi:MAG: hypothetical protein OEU94_07065 [Aquincola sp.]|nr:hypothetical protein [Aquincola sp.]MDH4289084.1 hypothetical protein [Aquincola sp.]MDH5330559.1 hypothetical protein [Aquincola sp.]
MGPLDALWHLLNFLAPAGGVALATALLAKIVWRRELAGSSLLRLWAWGSLAGIAALVAGLAIGGRDGRMATYGALVGAIAMALWWVGFVRR